MKNYTYDELMQMSIVELTSIAESSRIEINNSFRKSLVSDILQRQTEATRKPSELHARDRYAVADQILPRQ